LSIIASKQQMVRFFEIIAKNHSEIGTRKLNLSDCGLGDASISVVAKVLKNSDAFA
jgi:hypothetical protein